MEAKGNDSGVADNAVSLKSYWIDNNRFHIFNGVCILTKLYDYGEIQLFCLNMYSPFTAQLCDSQILADFFTGASQSTEVCLELNVTVNLSKEDIKCKDLGVNDML